MSDKIRILHVTDKLGITSSGDIGTGRLFSWWHPHFDRSRFEVRLLGLRPFDASTSDIHFGADVDCLGKGRFEMSTAAALRQIVRDWRADIVHLHGYGATNFGRIATRGMTIKVVVHEHFVDPTMPLYQQLADYVLSPITDAAIASSHAVGEFMNTHRRLPADKVRVIYDGVPLQGRLPVRAGHAEEARRQWGIPQQVPVIGALGRLDEQRGFTYLLEAAAILTANGFDARYVIAGEGPLLGPLREQASNYGISDRVVFANDADDYRRLQAMFEVQVIPSLWEGAPLSAFEAMAMGKPIVATNVDSQGEVLEDAVNALLVRPRDSLGLSDQLKRLLVEPQLAALLARRAAADSSRYDTEVTVRQMEQVYEQLMLPVDPALAQLGTG